MYAISILLTRPKHLVVIPASWIASLDIVQIFNIGISKTKKHRLFYSPELDVEPSFKMDIEYFFMPENRANYIGKILSVWATYEDAFYHMGSRRHVLPAIYNANLERFQWNAEPENDEGEQIKREPMAGLIWMPENAAIIEILDTDDEGDLVDGEENIDLAIAEGNPNDEHAQVEATVLDATQDVKPKLVFPHLPDEIIDINDNEDFIRNEIAFCGTDISAEMDCNLEWIGEFAKPMVEPKSEECLHANEKVPIADKLLGQIPYEVDIVNNVYKIKLDGEEIKMTGKVYNLLKYWNELPMFADKLLDGKFVVFLVASYVRVDEVRNGDTIAPDDIRLRLTREIFRNRVSDDEGRMQWYAGFISNVNDWLKRAHPEPKQ